MNRNETKLIVENWRNYLDENKNKQINEIDLASVQQYMPQITAAGAAMGIGSLLIRHLFKKFVHKFITRGQNKEAFLKFIDLLNFIYNDESEHKWRPLKDISNSDIENWISSGQETIANSFKDPRPRKMEKYRKKQNARRLHLYAQNIKALMSNWNPKIAIKVFDDIIQNNDRHEYEKITPIISNIYDTYKNEYGGNSDDEYMEEDQFVLDVIFETMLYYFKMYHSKLAKDAEKSIENLQKKFGNQISVETSDSGEVTITADEDADIECVLTLADTGAKLFMQDRDFYSTDQIKVSIRVDKDIKDEFYDRRGKSISFAQKLETLKKVLVFAKSVVGASAVSGPIAFIKAFVKSFTKDEALGKIANELQSKVDNKEIDDSSDFKTNEFIKFIIAICLE